MAEFHVLLFMQLTVVCDVTKRSLIRINQCFGDICCLLFQGNITKNIARKNDQ